VSRRGRMLEIKVAERRNVKKKEYKKKYEVKKQKRKATVHGGE